MAYSLHIPPTISHFYHNESSARRAEKRRNRNSPLLVKNPTHYNVLRSSAFGMLPSGVGSDGIVVLRVLSALGGGAAEKRKTSAAGLFPGMSLSFEGVRGYNFAADCVKVMANLQLLAILTGMAMGMGVQAASASSFEERRLGGRCADSRRLNEFGEAEEDFVGQDALQMVRNGRARTSGVAMAAEEDGGDEEARLDSDEEQEDWRANHYAITVPLKIVGLRGSVPPVWLKDFMVSQGKRAKVMAEFKGSLLSIFTELKSALKSKRVNSRSPMAADLVTIGDSWLDKAVCEGLITPIENAERFDWYQRLGAKWQTFVRRDGHGSINSNGKVWAVPYRWGSVVIAYNHEKLQKRGISGIKDWSDLWKPELAGKISMVASPREVVGAVLKCLGASYNVNDFETDVPGGRQAMKEKYSELQKQVLLFDNTQYLKTLGAGDVWVAVGWSEDVIPFAKRTSNITVVSPESGSSLWADLWAIPATTTIDSTEVGGRIRGPSPLVVQWLDFCLQPARANSFLNNVIVGVSPLALPGREVPFETVEGPENNASLLSNQVKDSRSSAEKTWVGLMTPDVLSKSEFLEPLTNTALDDFNWLLPKQKHNPNFPARVVDTLRNKFHRMWDGTRSWVIKTKTA